MSKGLREALRTLSPAIGGAPVITIGRRQPPTPRGRDRTLAERAQQWHTWPGQDAVDRPRLGLAMIVRDEGAVLARCLDSVRHIIGWWTIVDTGSVDNTTDIIAEKLGHIPGTLYRREWRNFAENRSEVVALARGTADYLLLLDADHEVMLEGFDASLLRHDAYDIQVRDSVTHDMPYLVRGDLPWYYEGKTHEYLTCDQPLERGSLRTLAIRHHADGGTRHEKFERDLRMLEEAFRDNPNDVRTVFYLAQTRQNMGDHSGALAAYRRRIELGGWDEEIFWSLYQSAQILAARGEWSHAQTAYLAAYEFRPSRAEPLFRLAQAARGRGQFRTAKLFADQAASIRRPGDRLFVEHWVYDWGIDFELSVALWWTGDRIRGREITHRLARRTDLPDDYRASVAANLIAYDAV